MPVLHALGEDDWDEWEDDTRRGVRDQFRWSLQALACDPDDQITLFPDFVCKADELVLDYGHWSELARSRFAGEFSADQLATLKAIDDRIDATSYGGAEFEEELWYEEALGTRPELRVRLKDAEQLLVVGNRRTFQVRPANMLRRGETYRWTVAAIPAHALFYWPDGTFIGEDELLREGDTATVPLGTTPPAY